MDHSTREQEVQGSIPDLVVPEMYTSLINAKHGIIKITLATISSILETPLNMRRIPSGMSDRKWLN